MASTPFDFRKPTALGARIGADDEQLKIGKGYDHNFVLDGGVTKKPRLVASMHEPKSGRVLEIITTEPGLQLYTGNFLDGTIKGKGGKVYAQRSAFCLEIAALPRLAQPPVVPAGGAASRARTTSRPRSIASPPSRRRPPSSGGRRQRGGGAEVLRCLGGLEWRASSTTTPTSATTWSRGSTGAALAALGELGYRQADGFQERRRGARLLPRGGDDGRRLRRRGGRAPRRRDRPRGRALRERRGGVPAAAGGDLRQASARWGCTACRCRASSAA